MRARGVLLPLLVISLFAQTLGARSAEARRGPAPTVDQLLDLQDRPFAIGHRGFGENLGEDPSRPIENTVRAVRSGFRAGVSVVEVDVQLTRDGQVAVFHDDFLADFTCINQLTLAELRDREPQIPSLADVLEQARQFGRQSGPLRGLVIVELKAAAPLCDPDDGQEPAIVATVVGVIREMDMAKQTMLASLSPALLYLAAAEAPEITRVLTVSGLQFLTGLEVEAIFGVPVRAIDKGLDLGLRWGEVGLLFRLPGYQSVAEVLSTAAVIGARVVEADLFLLSSAGKPFVEALQGFGLKVFGFTANDAEDWFLLESLGVDGIYVNDVPFGVAHQAPMP